MVLTLVCTQAFEDADVQFKIQVLQFNGYSSLLDRAPDGVLFIA